MDLKRRMCIEEIGVKPAAVHAGFGGADEREEIANDRIGVIAVEMRPEIDLPAHGPSDRFIPAPF
jgi:hypothetical protein